MRTDLPPALTTLAEVAWGLTRRAPSARLAIARAGGILEPEAFTPGMREAILREVEAARASACTPLATKDVEGALKGAWGGAPAKVLDEFGPEPLAITPTAQVHRGQYDGTPVAIKVRRPGVERAVRNDLSLLDVVSGPLGSAFPRVDAGAVLRDIREQVLDELDFEHEASTQRRVARAVREVGGVVVPRPIMDLCSPGVLVSELVEGTTLADGGAPPDPAAAAQTLVEAARTAVLGAGLAFVDLRASHVVVRADGGLALLGTGTARPVDRGRAEGALEALRAFVAGDPEAFGQRVETTGLLTADVAAEAHPVVREVAGDLLNGRPATLDAEALRDTGVRAWAAAPQLARLMMTASPHPEDLTLGRAFGQLVAVLARLRATQDWARLV